MAKKVGQPRKHIIYDTEKNIVDGLSYDEKNDTYFASYKDEQGKYKKFNCGRDKLEAIARFRRWQSEKEGNLLPVIQAIKKRFTVLGTEQVVPYLPEEFIWNEALKLILDNPILAAQKLKMPFLADPNFIKTYKPKKSYTLDEIGDNYFNRVNHIHKRELKNTRHSWAKFVSIVKVNTIIDLNREVIRTYFDKLYSEFKKGKSTSWIKNHFEKVKRIFNYAADSFDDSVELIEVKQRLRAVLKAPKDSVLFPAKKIPKEIFWQIIEASTTEEKAMWFLSLNLAYYGVDLVTLPFSSLDLNNKTVIFRRGKTGIHRAGILWTETIQAIKDYQNEKPHRGSTLFLNLQAKIPYSPSRIYKKFSKLIKTLEQKEQLKLKENKNYLTVNFDYCHSNFRDSFESICAAKNIPQRAIDGVMGHTGIAAKYTDVESTPEITAPACQAVWEYYFEDKTLGDVKN